MVVAPAIHSGLRLAPTAEVQIILEEVVEEKDQSSPGLGQQRRQKMKRKSESSLFTLDCGFHISRDNKHTLKSRRTVQLCGQQASSRQQLF